MNRNRTDKKALEWVSSYQVENYDWVSSVTYPETEDFDIDLTLTTVDGDVYKEEVKTSRNHCLKDELGNWNDYYSLSSTNGMYRNLYWGNLPDKTDTVGQIRNIDYNSINFFPSIEEQIKMDFNPRETPEHLKDKYVYVLNASAIDRWNGGVNLLPNNCKFYQMMQGSDKCLIYLAGDGFLIWNPRQLKEAFLGYVWMYCKHTNDFANQDRSYELKAMFDMSKATYKKADVPTEIFN